MTTELVVTPATPSATLATLGTPLEVTVMLPVKSATGVLAVALVIVTPTPLLVSALMLHAASDVPAVNDPPSPTPFLAPKAPLAVPAAILEKAVATCCAVDPLAPAVHVNPLKVTDCPEASAPNVVVELSVTGVTPAVAVVIDALAAPPPVATAKLATPVVFAVVLVNVTRAVPAPPAAPTSTIWPRFPTAASAADPQRNNQAFQARAKAGSNPRFFL